MCLAVDRLPKVETIRAEINKRYDELYHTTKDGERKPYVCVFCDEFIVSIADKCTIGSKMMENRRQLMSWTNFVDDRRKVELEHYYQAPADVIARFPFLSGMALSPRCNVVEESHTRSGRRLTRKVCSFICCKRCKSNVERKFVPRHAILNSNYSGAAPPCLTVLTVVELAFLTPLKRYGFCISFSGGKQTNLKGTMTFMRMEKRAIVESVATLDDMGLNDNVLVLYSGRLTPWQKRRAEELCQVRTDKLIEAAKWLCENNDKWRNVDYQEVIKNLEQKTPVVVDRSSEIEATNGLGSNVEQEEIFTCFYPDGAMSPSNGGFDSPDGFKEYVTEMAQRGYKVEFQANIQQKYVRGDDPDLLVDSCLLQFPYGIGGMNDTRMLKDGSFSDRADIEEYVEHMSRKSQLVFQKPMFQLVQYSLLSKYWLLKTSRLQLRGETDASNLANGLLSGDVINSINGRRLKHRYAGTTNSRRFLDAVDATAKALPHTNEAAKKARQQGEAMQHHFGMSSVFVTFTFDDENSLVMQVLSGEDIDDDTPTENLSDEQVLERANRRRELRIEYPGIAALNFEMQLEILLEVVIGWDRRAHSPTDAGGLFGKVYALCYAIEEQGRKTLHVHMSLWIEGFKQLQDIMFHGKLSEKEKAREELRKYYDHIASTSFFPCPETHTKSEIRNAFDHKCPIPKRNRKIPQVVDGQMLRNLRNRYGYKEFEGHFASCPHPECTKTWTYEDMVCDYLDNSHGIPSPPDDTNRVSTARPTPKARMMSHIAQFQRGNADVPMTCISATYQHHSSCHVSSCFRCQKKGHKKRGHVCTAKCECRFRLPDVKRRRVEFFSTDDEAAWFYWDGTKGTQPLTQILPRRNTYDLFQNVSCPAVTFSKMACNNNVALVLDGPIGQYMHKYREKPTQEEETAEYAQVESLMKRANADKRVHELDRSEALRRICRASFAHNKSNVISPVFASAYCRTNSRFYYSHEFHYCHLKNVVKLHNKELVSGTLKYAPDGSQFLENGGLDYLCRHEDLERESLKSFTENYFSRYVPASFDDNKKDLDLFPFQPSTKRYKHPSFVDRKGSKRFGKCNRGVEPRQERAYARVPQWCFPDTANFKVNIFTCTSDQRNRHMEEYAQLVLTLLLPHRTNEDLQSGTIFPYLTKLQEVYWAENALPSADKVVFTEENKAFLQNLQDCRANTLRHQIRDDPLSSKTEAFKPRCALTGEVMEGDEPEEEPETGYEVFSELLQKQLDTPDLRDRDHDFLPDQLQDFKLSHMRDKGHAGCGRRRDVQPPPLQQPIKLIHETTTVNPPTEEEPIDAPETEKKKYSIKDIVQLHLKKTELKTRVVWEDAKGKKTITTPDASGSVKSVRDWSKAIFQRDRRQQRAFETILSSFLLTFYEDDPDDGLDTTNSTDDTQNIRMRARYRREQMALKKLRGKRIKSNLVCLLHGPGGSGKTAVINAVKAYAKSYCEGHGQELTRRTIIVTAMSGVAATLLNGETTHSVLGLNRKKQLTPADAAEWYDARLLIVDECSFAAGADFDKMHENLKYFMQNTYSKFGGLNVVFAGDYSQLEPVNKEPVYKDDHWFGNFQGALNCYIELQGKWRFEQKYGEIMARMRSGTTTQEDIDIINSRYLYDHDPPAGIQVATYTNKDRDAINAAIFDDFTKENVQKDENGNRLIFESACFVLMDNLFMNDSTKTPTPITSNTVKRYFYEHCTESECNYDKNKPRVDPVLKLYANCPMMLTQNTDVIHGEANGSRVTVKQVVLKPDEHPFKLTLANRTPIPTVFASQVHHITVQHENPDITPRHFDVQSSDFGFTSRLFLDFQDIFVKMKGRQFPLISNSCTTGHKLQGCTVNNILVNSWFYGTNWPYVVLSRVRSLEGLYIRERLSYDLKKYAKPVEMKRMLDDFAERIPVTEFTPEEYEELTHVSEE